MRIRQNYPIADRIRLLAILLLILLISCSLVISKDESKEIATIESLLEHALEPVGSTMYIWGGGWNDTDSAAGSTSTQIGLSPKWKLFANQQDEHYDFTQHRFERKNGLDCSGYVGWVVYNTFEQVAGQPGYVTTSTEMAQSFADRGWGKLIENPKEFLPGDIVSMEGHVWICLGTCTDGSVLLIHSSPPGVSVCGTPVQGEWQTANSDLGKSVAVQLAENFMTHYYPDWQERYPNRMTSQAYLENVSLLRWSSDVMLDANDYQKLSGEKMLEILGQIVAR